jgi:hypothetical protein
MTCDGSCACARAVTLRREVSGQLADGMSTLTTKLEVGGCSLYVVTGYSSGRLAYLEVTPGNHGSQAAVRYDDPVAVEVAVEGFAALRGFLEVCCRMATELLQAEVWTAADLIHAWRGTKFPPDGVCGQLAGLTSSPLDALAQVVSRQMGGADA